MTTPGIPEVTASAVDAGAVLVDVREPREWAAGHAESAVHIPMSEVADRLSDLPMGDPLYVICRSGSRSARVVGFFQSQGIDAVNVADGMVGWAAARKPMVSDSGQPPVVI